MMKKISASLLVYGLLICAAFAQVPNAGSPMVPNASPGTGGGGGGTPCITTALSLQYNNDGTFGCVSGVISDATALNFSANTLKLLGSSSGTSIINAPATGGGTATLFPGSDTIVGLAATQTLTNKTINGANNTLTVRLGSDVTGNLPVTNLNSGTGAGATTFWNGAGSWAAAVTSVSAGCGVNSGGSPITGVGTIASQVTTRSNTATTDTTSPSDCGNFVTESNAAAVAVNLPVASGSFATGFFYKHINQGAGLVTITPTTSTINGQATLQLATGQSADISSQSGNYIAAVNGPGTVTSASVTTANGVSASVATPNSTPAFTFTLGAITPTSVAIGGGSAITSSGAGGALGTNAFTSTAYAPLASPTFTGTVTLPDSSTITTAGYNSVKALGIGVAAPSAGGAIEINAIGVTSTDGLFLENTTAAVLGTQQWSPRLHLKGNGWTTATSASMSSDVIFEAQPIQSSSSSPTVGWAISTAVNGSAYTKSIDWNVLAANSPGVLSVSGNIDACATCFIAWAGHIGFSSPGVQVVAIGNSPAASPTSNTLTYQEASGTNSAAATTGTFVGPLATGTGTNGDLILATGTKTTTGATLGTITTAFTLKGETQEAIFAAPFRAKGYIVSTLPAGNQGDMAFVTDAVACTFLAALTGSGSTICPVFYNGTAWVGG